VAAKPTLVLLSHAPPRGFLNVDPCTGLASATIDNFSNADQSSGQQGARNIVLRVTRAGDNLLAIKAGGVAIANAGSPLRVQTHHD
jgi:hypothetical protein